MLWRASKLKRIRHCGRVPRSNEGAVTFRVLDAVGGYSGVQHCGSVWACPVCAGRILVHRALEIGAVLGRAIEQGHPLGFVTLTMRHHQGQELAELWGAASKGWRRSISGKGWVAVEPMVEGWVRVWEVTHGINGWHVHVHLVVVLAPGSTGDDLDLVAGGMFDRWCRGLVAAGLEAPLLRGQEWHLATGEAAAADLAEYLVKSVQVVDEAAQRAATATGLGLELTHTMPGRAREGLKTQPVWSLLDDLVATGEASALARWNAWEQASKGRRQVGWSVGLRERFAPEVEELSDDQVVAEELGTEADDVLAWTADQWRSFIARPDRAVALLDAAAHGGRDAVVALVESWGVECTIIGERTEQGDRGGRGRRQPTPAHTGDQLIRSG